MYESISTGIGQKSKGENSVSDFARDTEVCLKYPEYSVISTKSRPHDPKFSVCSGHASVVDTLFGYCLVLYSVHVPSSAAFPPSGRMRDQLAQRRSPFRLLVADASPVVTGFERGCIEMTAAETTVMLAFAATATAKNFPGLMFPFLICVQAIYQEL